MSNIPKEGSSQWKKNESIIAKNPFLRAQRDKKEGLGTSSAINSGVNDEQYKENYDKIKWSKDKKEKPKFRIKINGKYQDEEE